MFDPRFFRAAKVKTILLGVLVLIVLAGAGTAYMVFFQGDVLRAWVKKQIEAIAAENLNPTFTFDDFEYIHPGTVKIHDVKLTADTPDLPEGELVIARIKTLTLTLGEIPSRGKPIKISQIILDQPELRLVVDKPGGTDFYGFSNMLRNAPTDSTTSDEPVKLSEVFEIRKIALNQGLIVYDTRDGKSEPMVLDGLTTSLDLKDPKDGWHSIALAFDRSPILKLTANGRLHLDDMKLELQGTQGDVVQQVTLAAQVNRANDSTLPPQLQAILREYQVEGALSIAAGGLVNLNDVLTSDIKLTASLADGKFVSEPYVLPIKNLSVDALLQSGVLTLEPLKIQTLDGVIETSGKMNLTGDRKIDLKTQIQNIRLEKTLMRNEANQDKPFKYAGLLNGNVAINGPAEKLAEQAGGSGELHLTEGRLIKIPILSDIGNAVEGLTQLGGQPKYRDTADILFNFAGDKITFTDIDVRTAALALRGKGDVFFNETLDLVFNGGPLEKVQSMLGQAGKIIGKVTDAVSGYIVKGTLSEPTVSVKVLGVGGGDKPKPKDVIKDVTKIIGDGGQNAGDGAGKAADEAGKAIEGAGNVIKGILD
jgi:hypothetical protein